jgi:hypothetical protein
MNPFSFSDRPCALACGKAPLRRLAAHSKALRARRCRLQIGDTAECNSALLPFSFLCGLCVLCVTPPSAAAVPPRRPVAIRACGAVGGE